MPPFIAEKGPTDPAATSPYRSTITEFVKRYSQTPERITILKGLLEYRKKLRGIGITEGFQWIDGSFVENVELNRGRPPADVDLVTFGFRPSETDNDWNKLLHNNEDIFYSDISKEKYYCDAYFVDLSLNPMHVVKSTSYWFGVFSHQRESYLWKGMIEIPIQCTDDDALKLLEEVGNA